MTSPPIHSWVHRLSLITLGTTIALVFALGGAVTSTEVGMAYPTWADINGWSLFNFFYGKISGEFGIGASLEHSHRQAGALIGLLSIALVIISTVGRDIPRSWKTISLATFALVVTQGLIGAFRVLENNDELGGVIHAVLAHGVVALLVILAKISSSNWYSPTTVGLKSQRLRLILWSRVGIVILLLNLVAAATLRHKVGNFPAHLFFGIATAGVWAGCGIMASRLESTQSVLAKSGRRVLGTVVAQALLGTSVWFYLMGPGKTSSLGAEERFLLEATLTTGHLLIGALVTAAATALFFEVGWRTQSNPR